MQDLAGNFRLMIVKRSFGPFQKPTKNIIMNKKFHHTLSALAATALLAAPAIFTACNDDESTRGNIYDAIVTVFPAEKGVHYIVNDSVYVTPSNITRPIYGNREVRALTRFVVPATSAGLTNGQEVEVLAIDSILTKPSTQWTETVDKELGNDPIAIAGDWLTVAEDGYLTLHFFVRNSYAGAPHSLHLLKGRDPEKPYELELRHTANGSATGSYVGGYVAFDIKGILPAGTDKSVNLTVRYRDFNDREASVTIPCHGLGKRHYYYTDATKF